MATPEIPQKAPMPVDVEEGRKYFGALVAKAIANRFATVPTRAPIFCQ